MSLFYKREPVPNQFIIPMEFYDKKEVIDPYILRSDCDAELKENQFRFKTYASMRNYYDSCLNAIYDNLRKNGYEYIHRVYITGEKDIAEDKNYPGTTFRILISSKYGNSVALRVIGNHIIINTKFKNPFAKIFDCIDISKYKL